MYVLMKLHYLLVGIFFFRCLYLVHYLSLVNQWKRLGERLWKTTLHSAVSGQKLHRVLLT